MCCDLVFECMFSSDDIHLSFEIKLICTGVVTVIFFAAVVYKKAHHTPAVSGGVRRVMKP